MFIADVAGKKSLGLVERKVLSAKHFAAPELQILWGSSFHKHLVTPGLKMNNGQGYSLREP
jgi:hypothetical protein